MSSAAYRRYTIRVCGLVIDYSARAFKLAKAKSTVYRVNNSFTFMQIADINATQSTRCLNEMRIVEGVAAFVVISNGFDAHKDRNNYPAATIYGHSRAESVSAFACTLV